MSRRTLDAHVAVVAVVVVAVVVVAFVATPARAICNLRVTANIPNVDDFAPGVYEFTLLRSTHNSRPTYSAAAAGTDGGNYFLFHAAVPVASPSSSNASDTIVEGRWTITRTRVGDLAPASTLVHAPTWAPNPRAIHYVSPNAHWFSREYRHHFSRMRFECTTGPDHSLYVHTERTPELTGYYVETGQLHGERVVFASARHRLFYYAPHARWQIAEQLGEASLAYVESHAVWPGLIDKHHGPLDEELRAYDEEAAEAAAGDAAAAAAAAAARRERQRDDHPPVWRVYDGDEWIEDADFTIVANDEDGLDEIADRAAESRTAEANRRRRARAATAATDKNNNDSDDNSNDDDVHMSVFEKMRVQLGNYHRRTSPPETMYLRLSNGAMMPALSYGTGGLQAGRKTEAAVWSAWSVGFRAFDLSSAYHTEESLGAVLLRGSRAVPRHMVHLTTKAWFSELGYHETIQAVHDSLERLGTSYIDLYLLHWPRCYPHISWMDCTQASGLEWPEGADRTRVRGTPPRRRWIDSWRALERLYAEGVLLSIGVSNFDAADLDELLALAVTPPHVVQNWYDPRHDDHAVIAKAQDAGVVYQAYSPLRQLATAQQGPYAEARQIAEQLGARFRKATAAQVTLLWCLAQGIAVTTRSSRPTHMREAFITQRGLLQTRGDADDADVDDAAVREIELNKRLKLAARPWRVRPWMPMKALQALGNLFTPQPGRQYIPLLPTLEGAWRDAAREANVVHSFLRVRRNRALRTSQGFEIPNFARLKEEL